LEIKGMWLEYWLILFSTSCFANLLGLNISSTFNSAKVIYILIPIMIIPQLLFSGVIVKFDKLHPVFSEEDRVPWIGNIMASRWAYEALAVTQYKRNKFEAPFYSVKQLESEAAWKRDYWLPEMRNLQSFVYKYAEEKDKKEEVKRARTVLIHEITQEERLYDPSENFVCEGCVTSLENKTWDDVVNSTLTNYLKILKKIYNAEVNETIDSKSALLEETGVEKFQALKAAYYNESLSDFVTNRNDLDKIMQVNGKLIQKSDPIYQIPRGKSFFDSQFYAPGKNIFGVYVSTLVGNVLMLWFMTVLFVITLYFDFFRKIIEGIGNLISRIRG
jgi:hypothetical protein